VISSDFDHIWGAKDLEWKVTWKGRNAENAVFSSFSGLFFQFRPSEIEAKMRRKWQQPVQFLTHFWHYKRKTWPIWRGLRNWKEKGSWSIILELEIKRIMMEKQDFKAWKQDWRSLLIQFFFQLSCISILVSFHLL
jgi:hypothetical protein